MEITLIEPAPMPLGLPAVLQAAAAELAQLACMAEGLGICPMANAEQWQSLDRMSQHLGELSTFLSAISVAIPDLRPDLGDALAAIRLGKLASRLAADPAGYEEEDSGELELFGA